MKRLVALLSLFAAIASAGPALAQSEPRLALLIGNQDYPSEPGRLRRPHRDVETLRAALEQAGFEVAAVLDADGSEIEDAVAAFGERLREAGPDAVGFFYYAGHGAVANAQGARRNFMLPAGVEVANATAVAQRGVRLDRQIDALESAGAAALFIVYDACRNSFSRGGRGFTVEQQRSGLLVAMSTMADATTPDDGAYAVALAEQIRRPGQRAENVFINASQLVGQGRPNDELPTVSPALRGEFCFLSCASAGAPPPIDEDLAAWERATSEGSTEALQAYLDAQPEGRFRASAELMIAALGAPEDDAGDNASSRVEDEAQTNAEEASTSPAPATGGEAPAPGTVFRDSLRSGGEGPEMVVVPAGSFMMGANDGPSEWRPMHRVDISTSFAIGVHEVTVDEWEQCERAGDCPANEYVAYARELRPGLGNHPMNSVTWDQAQQYVTWLSAHSGARYRLPSEAEWEFAARAGSSEPYSWGAETPSCDTASENGANFLDCGHDPERRVRGALDNTTEVATYLANEFGLFDVHGNVWEMVEDCFEDNHVGAPTDGSARANPECSIRVVRGGSWRNNGLGIRSASRSLISRFDISDQTGFRVARDLDH